MKKRKAKAGEYAQNNAWKPIFSVLRKRDENSYCWESDDQSTWDEPSVREVHPKNCEKTELDKFCRNLVFYIPPAMVVLPSCGGNKSINYPLSKAMCGWRNIPKFDTMINDIDNRNDSKVCKCKRTDNRGILQHLKVKSEQCAFRKATKL